MGRADHVVVDERHGLDYGSVDVGRGGEVQYSVKSSNLAPHYVVDRGAQVVVHEFTPSSVLIPVIRLGYPVEVARGVEAVQEHHLGVGVAEEMLGDVVTYEAGAPR